MGAPVTAELHLTVVDGRLAPEVDAELRAALEERQARLENEPGAVIVLSTGIVPDNGRPFVEVALNCLPPGEVHHAMAFRYPRIADAIRAQGYHVGEQTILTLRSYRDVTAPPA